MFTLKAADFVCYLKDTFVPHGVEGWESLDDGSIRKPGILVKLDIRMADYENDKRRGGDIWFVLAGNCNAFAYFTEKHMWESELPYAEFENISNHDSCWRSSVGDFLTKIYFQWAKEINDDKAPRDLSTHCFLGLSCHELVSVTYETNTDTERYKKYRDSYWKRLVKVERRDAQEQAKQA